MNISVHHFTVDNLSSLQDKWSELFSYSKQSAFLDWNWISPWLKSMPSAPTVIEAKLNEEPIGLGLLCEKTQKVFFGCFNVKQLWLHKYGIEKFDQPWIEHNDFLLHKDYENETRQAILSYIKTTLGGWHEFYIGMTRQSLLTKYSLALGEPRYIVSAPDFSVDLTKTQDISEYLSSLSKNTRSQINRSQKLLNKLGDVQLSRADTAQDKQQYFAEISLLHQQKWRDTELGSGFDNPIFTDFHKNIIFSDTDNKYSTLYALELNGQALALVYLLKNTDTWYFYLSGIQTHPDNKIKIGLLIHTLVIEQAINCGIKKYSFLAGDARYKQSMSNIREEPQSLVCFTKDSVLLKLISYCRQFKQVILPSNNN